LVDTASKKVKINGGHNLESLVEMVDRAGFEPATSRISDQLLCQAGVRWPFQHTKLNYRPNKRQRDDGGAK